MCVPLGRRVGCWCAPVCEREREGEREGMGISTGKYACVSAESDESDEREYGVRTKQIIA